MAPQSLTGRDGRSIVVRTLLHSWGCSSTVPLLLPIPPSDARAPAETAVRPTRAALHKVSNSLSTGSTKLPRPGDGGSRSRATMPSTATVGMSFTRASASTMLSRTCPSNWKSRPSPSEWRCCFSCGGSRYDNDLGLASQEPSATTPCDRHSGASSSMRHRAALPADRLCGSPSGSGLGEPAAGLLALGGVDLAPCRQRFGCSREFLEVLCVVGLRPHRVRHR